MFGSFGMQMQPTLPSSRPAKMKVSERPKVQYSLELVDTAQDIIIQRGKPFYISNWMVASDTYKKLFHDYINSNSSDYHVSYGTFVALKPFYVRCTTSKEIEMCCCKLYLHARWSVMCMLEIIQKCNIKVEFDSYETFFDYLTKNCASSSTTYIEWSCTPSKTVVCEEVLQNWVSLKTHLIALVDEKMHAKLMYFKKVEEMNNNGQIIYRLKAFQNDVNMQYVLHLISELLKDIIHHRNQLKHYRNVIN